MFGMIHMSVVVVSPVTKLVPLLSLPVLEVTSSVNAYCLSYRSLVLLLSIACPIGH